MSLITSDLFNRNISIVHPTLFFNSVIAPAPVSSKKNFNNEHHGTSYNCIIWNNATIAKPPNFNLKTAAESSKKKQQKKKTTQVQNHIICGEEMSPSTVKIYAENEGGVSRVITVMV